MSTTRIAISLPKTLLDQIEASRHERGVSRSALIVEAVRAWLEAQSEDERDRRYVEGYLRLPEGDDRAATMVSECVAAWEPWT